MDETLPAITLGDTSTPNTTQCDDIQGPSDCDLTSLSLGVQTKPFANAPTEFILDVLNEGVFYMTGNRLVFFYNPEFYKQFGIERDYIHCDDWLAKIHPFDRSLVKQRISEHMQSTHAPLQVQYRVSNGLGQYIWIEATGIVKFIEGQRTIVGCHRDITYAKSMESALQHAAFFDSASGLANAQKLEADIEYHSKNVSHSYSLIYIHLEDIRTYLALHGAQPMRKLMSHLLNSLSQLPDQLIDIYRVRPDDFAILVQGHYTQAEIESLADRLRSSYRESVEANGSLWGSDISIGVYPNFYIDQPSEEIVRIASCTCQFAREKEQNRLAVYYEHTQQRVNRHFFIEKELSRAIKQEQLSVKFQPIVDIKDHAIASFEALVRWNDKQIGNIFPDEFIPLAEKKGLIMELGNFVFRKACQFINHYYQQHANLVRININVSVLQLLNNNFPDQAKQIADEYQIPPEKIVIELTETVILDGNKCAISQLHRLKEFGFGLALDDFGSGYCSLNSFFDLPLNQIKVDKSMAWRALENPATLEYLRFIARLCQDYNVAVVIEGVEDAQMQRAFSDIGVDYLQGYWFSKPLSFASASAFTKI